MKVIVLLLIVLLSFNSILPGAFAIYLPAFLSLALFATAFASSKTKKDGAQASNFSDGAFSELLSPVIFLLQIFGIHTLIHLPLLNLINVALRYFFHIEYIVPSHNLFVILFTPELLFKFVHELPLVNLIAHSSFALVLVILTWDFLNASRGQFFALITSKISAIFVICTSLINLFCVSYERHIWTTTLVAGVALYIYRHYFPQGLLYEIEAIDDTWSNLTGLSAAPQEAHTLNGHFDSAESLHICGQALYMRLMSLIIIAAPLLVLPTQKATTTVVVNGKKIERINAELAHERQERIYYIYRYYNQLTKEQLEKYSADEIKEAQVMLINKAQKEQYSKEMAERRTAKKQKELEKQKRIDGYKRKREDALKKEQEKQFQDELKLIEKK